jgi:hypothetical protein
MLAMLGLAASATSASAQFQLGIVDPTLAEAPPQSNPAITVVKQIHASTIRILTNWASIAPAGGAAPAGFDPTNPADPRYRWTALDQTVRNAVNNHVTPLLEITGAPVWAQAAGEPASARALGGPWQPNPAAFAKFSYALALRYSGQFPDSLHPGSSLPRVKLYEIWDEPNLPGTLQSPDLVHEYAWLLNAAYGSIKSVNEGNVVSVGGLAPVYTGPPSMSPMKFASELLCLRQKGKGYVRSSSCPVRAHFDAFSIHPYTLTATPTKPAPKKGDLFVADVITIHKLLRAAEVLHTGATRTNYQLWVTEWSVFSKPPNPVIGLSDPVAARYVAWSMYEMFRDDVSLIVWEFIFYQPYDLRAATPALIYGGALYTTTGQPTLKFNAFEFPVIATIKGGHGLVWGRAPVGQSTQVLIQHLVRGKWQTIGRTRTAGDGVFEFHFGAHGNGTYRAVVPNGPVSVGYFSKPIPPRITAVVRGL